MFFPGSFKWLQAFFCDLRFLPKNTLATGETSFQNPPGLHQVGSSYPGEYASVLALPGTERTETEESRLRDVFFFFFFWGGGGLKLNTIFKPYDYFGFDVAKHSKTIN